MNAANCLRAWRGLALALGLSAALTAFAADPKLGVFYFPGWKEGARGLAYPRPWEPIKRYPEREPLLGWYDEGQPAVMEQHLAWMAGHGIGFVVFDWYWDGSRPVLDHAVRAYHASRGKRQLPYTVMWANHGEKVMSEGEIAALAEHLAREHFQRPEYLKVEGRPLLFLMSPEILERNAQALGVPHARLTGLIQAAARAAGLPGVLISGGAGGGINPVTRNARLWGYGAHFVYNYSAGMAGTRGQPRGTHSYAELDEVYREHWNWFMQRGELPFVLPLTSGWDKRPWGGSEDPKRDGSVSTVAQFAQHLKAGHETLRRHPEKTLGMGVLCCWNEFGEGSYVEPTKALGFQYLEAVKAVFGSRP
ncbi:MAG: glycoside hydrolase family 99-like domain-containing protein [Rubrivivax sp.]|nr:glycoside hydrolase family 99-like domain-containing protein [Rubrivivax sp.]